MVFRQRHARMVERVIGRRTGTGGSSGVDYLDQTALKYRVFRDLWAVRTLQVAREAAPPIENAAFYGFQAEGFQAEGSRPRVPGEKMSAAAGARPTRPPPAHPWTGRVGRGLPAIPENPLGACRPAAQRAAASSGPLSSQPPPRAL